ncbi:nuclear transport factor 2 family protein [Streptosporangium sp. NBC_01756]|uniref:nuclear transport factor 2 family protein n=1 Tax=Streptosporangium sp. NBC_01756 TaxID=2975950 RepID=UPI002DDA2A5B|nr:nuclear transport factor 2 family protein [Streptosporangium sp. NBC_01756]WSC85467.1 nuclear transport factor 2 family protein [Streptosporangium sp. NBC_01756]
MVGSADGLGPREVFELMGRHWLEGAAGFPGDLVAEDVVVEMPFAAPGGPRRIEGREKFRAFAEAGRAALPVRFEEIRDVAVHQTTDPETIVVEYEMAGTVTTTGHRADASFIGVLTVRDGKIVRWREYQNVPAIAAALGQLPALAAHHADQAG